MITTNENQYILEVMHEESTEETSRKCHKKTEESSHRHHKTELDKLDCPYSAKRRNNSARNAETRKAKIALDEETIGKLNENIVK